MRMKKKEVSLTTYSNLLDRIAGILAEARTKAVREINKAQVLAYWEIGREIVEFEQKGEIRAEYGERLLIRLSEDLTKKFSRGFSVDNLQLMRKFYITYAEKFQIYETPSRKSQKYETSSVKSQIPQTLSAKSQISQTPSDEFEPMLS
jgi:hypothetical protein